MRRQIRLAPLPTSIRAARDFAIESLTNYPAEVISSVALMVSELATNSVVHAATSFTVTLTITGSILQLDVHDEASSRPQLSAPSPSDPHGRGLRIIDHLATAWGTEASPTAAGKRTWFQLELPAPAPQ